MTNFEKWTSDNIFPDVIWLSITTGCDGDPCGSCPASDYCKNDANACCHDSFMAWAYAGNGYTEMTERDAIRKINSLPVMRLDKESSYTKRALQTAVVALEKQVPKAPLHSGTSWDCPTCLDNVGMMTSRGRILKHHHCRCGQAIDWSEE